MNILMNYKGETYPEYIRSEHAANFILPFAEKFCSGDGLDIGGLINCHFPGAKIINILNHDGYDAYNLPDGKYDYIFSSHTLEHVDNYVKALEYWITFLQPSGVLFLYLPHPDMEYWLPQNNRKHLHSFVPAATVKLLKDLGFKNVVHSERDLYWSFSVVGIGL
ncbi:MAG: class I SAM-dependent methyltransferase [Proteobacteria bacterium]|jgi:SAM-dependent methyltransferase|nr:class I SAM-dependent methyltransferase [Pseudomonadota bacterium]